MAVFGWFVLALVTVVSLFATVGVVVGSLGWSGKVGGECAFFAVICAALMYASYHTFPFIVTVAP